MVTIVLLVVLAVFFAPVIKGFVEYRKEERRKVKPEWDAQCDLALDTVLTRG